MEVLGLQQIHCVSLVMESNWSSDAYTLVVTERLTLINAIKCVGSRMDFSRFTLRPSLSNRCRSMAVASHLSW